MMNRSKNFWMLANRAGRFCAVLGIVALFDATAFGQFYAEPQGGWSYFFGGDAAADGGAGTGFTSLDGTWSHDNGSDEWDGSEIGSGTPGGVSALSDNGTSYIRLQDPGDPRDHGFDDPGSNRKQYFTHNITEEGAADSVIDDGVTLYFRTRIATAATGPLDLMHADGGTETEPWPEQGIGYHQHNSGKSPFAIRQVGGGDSTGAANVAFGLAYGDDVNSNVFGGQAGLVLPNLNIGNDLGGSDPDGGDPLATNIFPVDDPTEWQEFWITIEEGVVVDAAGFEDGTHLVNVYYADGEDPLAATEFGINAANGSDISSGSDPHSYIAIGAGATPRSGAFDVDFFAWAPGIHMPEMGNEEPILAGDVNGDGTVNLADFTLLKDAFGTNSGDTGFIAGADFDGNGNIGLPDFTTLKDNFGASAAVPEPATWILSLLGMSAALWCARRTSRT